MHAADGPQFTAVAACPEALAHRLAEYVRRKHEAQLWPADAARVRALLDAGELDAAVTMYFERVGERWDEEWLVTAQIDPSDWTSDR